MAGNQLILPQSLEFLFGELHVIIKPFISRSHLDKKNVAESL